MKCGSNKNLNVHHLTYERLFCEQMSDVEILCYSCHYTVHNTDKYDTNRKRIWTTKTYEQEIDGITYKLASSRYFSKFFVKSGYIICPNVLIGKLPDECWGLFLLLHAKAYRYANGFVFKSNKKSLSMQLRISIKTLDRRLKILSDMCIIKYIRHRYDLEFFMIHPENWILLEHKNVGTTKPKSKGILSGTVDNGVAEPKKGLLDGAELNLSDDIYDSCTESET